MGRASTRLLGLLILAGAPSPVLAQAAQDSIPEQVTPETIREGYELFQEASCRSCHGDRGRGGLVGGPNLRDNEWLHSEGDFDGIFRAIRWGVEEDELKAMTRPFEMRPRGGMLYTTGQMQALAAYIWAESNGRYESTEADDFVEAAFDRGDGDLANRYADLVSSVGQHPIAVSRMIGVTRDLARQGDVIDAVALAELTVADYPDDATAHYVLGQLYVNTDRREEGLAMVERALEINPDYTAARNYLNRQRG